MGYRMIWLAEVEPTCRYLGAPLARALRGAADAQVKRRPDSSAFKFQPNADARELEAALSAIRGKVHAPTPA